MESYSLFAFSKEHGKMKVTNPQQYINSQTGEEFTSWQVAFLHPVAKDTQGRPLATFVHFAKKLGKLTAAEIKARQHSLQICKDQKGKWVLCNKGSDSWEDVELEEE